MIEILLTISQRSSIKLIEVVPIESRQRTFYSLSSYFPVKVAKPKGIRYQCTELHTDSGGCDALVQLSFSRPWTMQTTRPIRPAVQATGETQPSHY